MTNPRLIKFAKTCLKEDLAKCTECQQNLFKMIYGSLDIEINSIIDDIPGDELNWAMNLVERTLKRKQASNIMDLKSAKELALMQHVTGHLDRRIKDIAKELNCSFTDAKKFRSQIRQEDAEKEGRCYH